MNKLNPNPSQDHNLQPRKDRPGWRRVFVGHRLIPMQASHVDEIAVLEAKERGDGGFRPRPGIRCSKCWLKDAKPGHFCRWNIARAVQPEPRPMLKVPIYRWVKTD